ncbi:hypothetical protein WA1_50185 [Scytonema hofmannii PCC 7110]|uniref:Uncharacterized protein n=1 Tax=Scytonema hofmannii PCC 7110 TaxID=128403 RepID=A0A139WR65_9CYAN|nr:hypothetical protein [Scytonema hofmannii]KYC34897.1 hypothetical protein WA1_50185 [Scytonema hofmannii PCC 7110]
MDKEQNSTLYAIDALSQQVPGISSAKMAYYLSEVLNQVEVDYESFQTSKVVPEIQQAALINLSEQIKAINNKVTDNRTNTTPDLETFELGKLESENNLETSNESRQVVNSKSPDGKLETKQNELKNESQNGNSEGVTIQKIISLILDRLLEQGRQAEAEGKERIYESQQYTAALQIEGNEQIVSLDRNNPKEDSPKEALLASKTTNEQEFRIIVNTLEKDELEKFNSLIAEESEKRALNLLKDKDTKEL